MPKVAHASLIYFRLSENWIHTQIKNLKGFESIVFTNEKENMSSVEWEPPIFSRGDDLSTGIREADSLAMWILGYYPSFYLKAKREQINLIHAHFGPMGYLCSGLAQRLDIPLVTTFYGYDASLLLEQEPKWKQKYQKLFKRGSIFLVEGPAMKEKLLSLGCNPDKVAIHHLGIEVNKYTPRQRYSTENKLNLLMVGRFVEKKGFLYGLKAFKEFKEQGGTGTLTIVGDSSGTPASDSVKKQLVDFVQEHDLESVVQFTGMIPLQELQRVYYDYDLFLAPSVKAQNGDNEGGAPVTLIEASATGMPVIGSRHCDIPEVVNHGETGLLADEKDVEQLTAHLFTIYKKSGLREKMGRAGAIHIREHFNASKQGEILSQRYMECVDR